MKTGKPSDKAFSFEAVLLGATKDKNGFVVKLAIHPNDVPDEFIKDLVGSRYQIGACRVDDDGQPVGKKKDDGGEIRHAALLCKNPNFQKFCVEQGALHESEHEAREMICTWCQVETRADLKFSENARKLFHEMVKTYERWLEQDTLHVPS